MNRNDSLIGACPNCGMLVYVWEDWIGQHHEFVRMEDSYHLVEEARVLDEGNGEEQLPSVMKVLVARPIEAWVPHVHIAKKRRWWQR